MKSRREMAKAFLGGGVLLLFVFTFVGQAVTQTCVQPPSGLIGWWPGDGNADDITGTNDGTLVGNATFTAGVVGQAFSLPGSSVMESHVLVPDAPDLQLTGPLSLDAWLSFSGVDPQTPGVSNGPIVAKWGDGIFGTAGYGLFVFANGTLDFAVSPDGSGIASVLSPTPLPTGTFVHVAGVYTGSQLELYVNGALVATAPFSGAIHGNNGVPLAIGGYITPYTHVNDSLVGIIDEVEVFNRALSGTEIQAIYSAGSAGKCKVTTVAIDIKPGSFPNSINPRDKGVIPVAILSTDTFDASTEDPTTVRFGPNGAAPVHYALEDVDGDTDLDLILHFKTQETGIRCGDTSATLTGETTGGQVIEGSDTVNTVGCK